jgi:hypothetical protein
MLDLFIPAIPTAGQPPSGELVSIRKAAQILRDIAITA